MSEKKQALEITFTDTDKMKFKAPFRGYLINVSNTHYIMGSNELAIRVNGKTPKEASQFLKETFLELAEELISKYRYTSLSERERKKLDIILSICDTGVN